MKRENRNRASRAWYHANGEKERARQRRRYRERVERESEFKRKKLEAAAAHYAANSDKRKIQIDAYNKRNPQYKMVSDQRRRARKFSASGEYTQADIDEIRRMQRDRCAMPTCRTKLHGKGTVDHIVALSKGGSNSRKNLQLLCRPCNSSKMNRDQIHILRCRGFLL